MQLKDLSIKSGLSEETIHKITDVFLEQPNITKAILYGSRAKGNFRNGSDIDLVLIGDKLIYNDLTKVVMRLDDLFLPYTFDISLFNQIDNPDLIDHISRVGLVFYPNNI